MSSRCAYGFFLATVLPVAASGQTASAALQAQSPQGQCAALSLQQFVAGAQRVRVPAQIESRLHVLPGGQNAKVQLTSPQNADEVYCAKFEEGGVAARVIEVAEVKTQQDDGKRTEITLSVPEMGFGWHRPRQLIVASFPVDAKGMLNTASPGVYAVREFPVSNGRFCMLVSLGVVILAYVVAVLSLGKVGTKYSWDPVYLTSDSTDKASLSQFQIFFFTLIVLWLLTFIVLRTGLLSDISLDVLLLLGISAAGAVGSKVAEQSKRRLSYENWAWLRNREWLTAYETGIGQQADAKRARWGDLLKTGGDFDIYSFQLVVFSVVVAYSLVSSGIDHLATFEIPDNLKSLLGLSNVVYIGGKAIGPNSVGELDRKLTDLRAAELDWVGAVVNAVKALPDPQAKLQAAIAAAPEKYQAYTGLAREIARMLKALYGASGTKFKTEPISDSDLMPAFP